MARVGLPEPAGPDARRRTVVPARRSRRKRSFSPFASPATRPSTGDWKTTRFPPSATWPADEPPAPVPARGRSRVLRPGADGAKRLPGHRSRGRTGAGHARRPSREPNVPAGRGRTTRLATVCRQQRLSLSTSSSAMPRAPADTLADEQRHLDATWRRLRRGARALRRAAAPRPSTSSPRRRSSACGSSACARTPRRAGRCTSAASTATDGGAALHRPPRRRRRSDNELLAINWRAPAAEPFYAATPADPRGVTAPPAARHRGARRCSASSTSSSPAGDGELHLTEAIVEDITRQRVGEMRQIISTITPEQYELIAAPRRRRARRPGRAGHGQDRGRPAPRRLAAVRRPGARARGRAGRRPEPHVHRLHRPGAAGAGRAERRAAADRRARLRAPRGGRRSRRSVPTLLGSGRMAALLARLLWDRVGAPAASPSRWWSAASTVGVEPDEVADADRRGARARARLPGRAASASATGSPTASRRACMERPRGAAARRRRRRWLGRRAQDAGVPAARDRCWPRQTPEALVAALFKNRRRLGGRGRRPARAEEIDLLLAPAPPARTGTMTPERVRAARRGALADRPRAAHASATWSSTRRRT